MKFVIITVIALTLKKQIYNRKNHKVKIQLLTTKNWRVRTVKEVTPLRKDELYLLCNLALRENHIRWSHSVLSDSLWHYGLQPSRLFCPWNSPDKNTGVGYHFLLLGIFPTQGSNLGLPHCRQCYSYMWFFLPATCSFA